MGPCLGLLKKLPLSRSCFSKLLSNTVASARLQTKNISPHSFRIAAATWAAARGLALNKLKQWVDGARHHSIATSESNPLLLPLR